MSLLSCPTKPTQPGDASNSLEIPAHAPHNTIPSTACGSSRLSQLIRKSDNNMSQVHTSRRVAIVQEIVPIEGGALLAGLPVSAALPKVQHALHLPPDLLLAQLHIIPHGPQTWRGVLIVEYPRLLFNAVYASLTSQELLQDV